MSATSKGFPGASPHSGTGQDEPGARLPPGVGHAYGFVLTNAISFSITLGAPVVLFAKALGASATVLGLIGALTPLLTTLQIPAARYIDRIGYRRFMLLGWSVRVVFIFVIALVPLADFLDRTTKLVLLMFCLFMFNLFRGISSGAWLPWITELIPEEQRSRYLARDHIFMHLGGFLAMCVGGFVLGNNPGGWQFGAVFLLSAIAGQASLFFIKRIPEGDSAETAKRSGTPVPWRAIVFYPPFHTLVVFNLLFAFFAASLGTFVVAFLKAPAGLPESLVLQSAGLGWLGALLTYPFLTPILERTGCRLMLRFALGVMTLLMLAWAAMAAGVLPAVWPVVVVASLVWGLAAANFNLANARVMMFTMPEMGRNHFYAFFSVITSLGMAVAPVAWGLALDAMSGLRWTVGPWQVEKYTIYFIGLAMLSLAAMLYSARLTEPPSRPAPQTRRAAVIEASLKRLQRLWQR